MELRNASDAVDDLVILYVLADNQVTDKTLRFIDGLGLRERVRFAMDPSSAAIDALGLRKPDPEPMETGVPMPATYLLDRDGVVRFADVRADYHRWLDSNFVRNALAHVR